MVHFTVSFYSYPSTLQHMKRWDVVLREERTNYNFKVSFLMGWNISGQEEMHLPNVYLTKKNEWLRL